MSTRTTAARRSVIPGLLALTVLTGTAATGVAATAAAAPASSAAKATTTSPTTDFGYLANITTSSTGATSLVLDRAILHTGRAAAAERARRGLSPLPEYYIQNDNPKLRTFRVRSDVKVYGSGHLAGSPVRKAISLTALKRHVRSTPKANRLPFTLKYDRQGRVAEIAEYYLP